MVQICPNSFKDPIILVVNLQYYKAILVLINKYDPNTNFINCQLLSSTLFYVGWDLEDLLNRQMVQFAAETDFFLVAQ